MPEGPRAGYHTFWREVGVGPRHGVAVHCSLAHSAALRGVLDPLSELLTTVAMDQPGHGRSGDWPGRTPFQDAMVSILHDFVAAAEGPVDLIGHSFGGTCALRVAVEAPERIRSLTLIEPPIYDALKGSGAPEMAQQDALDAPFAEALAREDYGAAARGFARTWGSGLPWETMPAEQRAYMIQRMPLIEGAGHMLNADTTGLLRPGVLEALDVPVLLIRGTVSPPAVPAILRVLAERLPQAETVVIGGAGHMVPITHPEPVAQLIREHILRT